MFRRLALSFLFSLALVAAPIGCDPKPVPADTTTASSWTDTARRVFDTLSWAVPAARVVVANVIPEPARTIVLRALDGVGEASSRLRVAVTAYEARGGDRCAAHAAVGGVRSALVELAQVLADNGVALGVPLERVADAAASVADALVPRCQVDAGWSSAGDRDNARLRAIVASAAARGVILRRDLDAIRPAGAQ